jgi:hypothetical protein
MIAESLNIAKTVVLRILKDDLGKRKLCAGFVHTPLPPEQREDRVTYCQHLIAVADAEKKFLLTPNGHYSGRSAPLTSRRCILNIYSTNIRTEYFKHAA